MADESSISTQVQKQNEQAVQAWNKKLIKDLKKRAAQESAENKDAINKMIKKLMSSSNEGSIASFLKTVPGKKPTKTKSPLLIEEIVEFSINTSADLTLCITALMITK